MQRWFCFDFRDICGMQKSVLPDEVLSETNASHSRELNAPRS